MLDRLDFADNFGIIFIFDFVQFFLIDFYFLVDIGELCNLQLRSILVLDIVEMLSFRLLQFIEKLCQLKVDSLFLGDVFHNRRHW